MEQEILKELKELSTNVALIRSEMNTRFKQVDKRFDRVDNEVHELRLEMEDLNAKVDKGFDGLLSLQKTTERVTAVEHVAENREDRTANLEASVRTRTNKN